MGTPPATDTAESQRPVAPARRDAHGPGRDPGLASLAREQSPELDSALESALEFGSRKTRLEAIRVIHTNSRYALIPKLSPLVESGDVTVAERALIATAALQGEAATDLVESYLADADSPIHGAALEAACHVDTSRLLNALVPHLLDEAYPWRHQVVEIIAQAPSRESTSILEDLVRDPDDVVALAAVRGLSLGWGPRTVGILESLIEETQTSVAAKRQILEIIAEKTEGHGLRRLGAPKGWPADVRRDFARLALEHQVDGLINVMMDLATDEDPVVADLALDHIDASSAQPDTSRLAKVLDSHVWSLRARVCEIVGSRRLHDAMAVLDRGLRDGNRHVREAALKAAMEIQDDRVQAHFERLITDESPANRTLAARGLGATGSQRARALLIANLEDPNPEVRLALIDALAHFDLTPCLDSLAVLAQDPSPDVRARVHKLLAGSSASSEPVSLAQAHYFLEVGQASEAERVLKKMRVANPFEPRVNHELAGIAMSAGRLQEAEELYERVLDHKPDHAGSLRQLGRLLMRKKDHEKARVRFTSLLDLKPESRSTRRDLGICNYRLGRFSSARELLESVVQSRPKDAIARRYLGLTLFHQGDLDEARQQLERVLALQPDDGPSLKALGEVEKRAGRHERAIDLFTRMVSVQPNHAGNLKRLILAYEQADQTVFALETLKQLVRLEPKDPNLLAWLGQLYVKAKKIDEAQRIANALLESDADSIPALTLTARIQEDQGDFSAALDTYFRIHAIDCHTPNLLLEIGHVYMKAGKREQAIRCFRDYLKDHPEDFGTRLDIGRVDLEEGRYKAAIQKFERCLQIRPDDAECHSLLAHALLESGDRDGAREHLTAAANYGQHDADARAKLGRFLLEEGDLDGALDSLSHAVELNERHSGAHRDLLILHSRRSNPARVIYHLERVKADLSDLPLISRLVAGAYRELGHYERAQEWVNRGLEVAHADVDLQLEAMKIALLEHDDERILRHGAMVLHVEPDNAQARREFVLAKARAKDPASLDLLRKALENSPDDLSLRLALADTLFRNQDHSALLSVLDGARTELPPTYIVMRATTHYRRNERETCAQVLETLIKEHPEIVEAHRFLAKTHREMGDLRSAEADLNRALRHHPEAMGLHLDRGRLYLDIDKIEQAKLDLDRAQGLAPNAVLSESLGRLEEKQGNLPRARFHLMDGLRLDPQKLESLVVLGRVERRLGDDEAALDSLDRALEIDPKHEESRLMAGEICVSLGRVETARVHFETYITCVPDGATALGHLARIHQDRGDSGIARSYLERLAELGTDPETTYQSLVGILFELGRADEAWKVLDATGDLRGILAMNLGRSAAEKGDPALARELFKRALADDPENVECHHELARSNVALGRIPVARSQLRRAIEISPGHAPSSRLLGRLALQAGDREEARVAFTRIIHESSDDTESLASLAEIDLDEGNTDRARDLADRALQSSRTSHTEGRENGDCPTAGILHHLMGRIHEKLQDFEAAHKHYVQSASRGGPPRALHRAGLISVKLGKFEQGRDLYRDSLERDATDVVAREALLRVERKLGNIEGAVNHARILGETRGFDAGLLRVLAHDLLGLQRLDEAWSSCQEFLSIAPEDPQSHLLAARIAAARGEGRRAMGHADWLITHHPQSPDGHHERAQLLIQQGRYQEALASERTAVSLDTRRAEFALGLGRIYSRLDMPDKARSTLETAVDLQSPPSTDLLLELARCYRALKMNRDAQNLLAKLSRTTDLGLDASLELASVLLEGREYSAAVELLRELKESHPDDAVVLEKLGLGYARMGMSTRAMGCLDELWSIAHVPEELILELADLSESSGRGSEALEMIQRGVERAPASLSLRLAQSRLLERLGRGAEARNILDELVKSHPGDVRVQESLGSLLVESREYSRLKEIFDVLAQKNPFALPAHLYLGQANQALGYYREAKRVYARALALDSTSVLASLGMARSLQETGDIAGAIDYYKSALKLKPTDAPGLFGLARCLDLTGQAELARYHLEELIRHEPAGTKWAARARERLRHGKQAA